MRHLFAVVLGSLFAAGCMGAVGDEGTGTGGPDSGTSTTGKKGQSTYVKDVHPTMSRCSGGACHNADAVSAALGKFYLMDSAAGYTKIVGAPTIVGEGAQAFSSIAPIISKIEAGHQGVTYSPEEKTKIVNWLALELEEHKDPSTPTTPSVNPKEVLKTFSGCLTIADFNTAQMAQKWSALAASNNQKCLNCHQAGGDGFIVNANADLMFKVMTENSAYLLKFFSVDTSGTPAKVVVNTGSFTNAGVTIAAHPRFDPLNNAGMIALKAFYDLAAAKQAAGTCGTPTIKD